MNGTNVFSSVLLRACAALLVFGAAVQAQGDGPRRTAPYDPEMVHVFRTLPVQEGGRVKPFETVAQYVLLRLNEKRTVSIPDEPRFGTLAGTKLSAAEWAMDVMLYPEQAADYPVFVVTDSETLQMIGLAEIAKKKRDRYSWNELAPGIDRLQPFYADYRRVEEAKRTRLQNQIVYLYNDLSEYFGLKGSLDAARATFPVGSSKILKNAFGDVEAVRFSDSAQRADRLQAQLSMLDGGGAQGTEQEVEREAVRDFLGAQLRVASRSSSLVWLPPSDQRSEVWLDFAGVYDEIRHDGPAAHKSQLEAIALLEEVADATAHPEQLKPAVVAWVDHVRQMADARGEGAKIGLEVSYLEADYFYKALIWFIGGFVFSALMWLWPRGRILPSLSWGLTLVGAGYVTVGVVVRCVLRGRPPVTTLYETILFITGVAVLVALAIEAINRRRIAISLGSFLGAVGMFVAGKFEVTDGRDTMPQLVAVLDTNFWLSTHVTTVTIGYAAGLLAGSLATVFLLGKLFGLKKGSYSFYRSIGRMVYGVLCFGVVFSTIGTILGGIWANESWGRFWGWDPKENGALLIVLWELMILHGRLGGFWRDWGISFLAVLGNIVVAFSWWGVNLMGVGLHSYGFTAGLKEAVTWYYLSQLIILGLGIIAFGLEKRAAAAAKTVADPGKLEPAEA